MILLVDTLEVSCSFVVSCVLFSFVPHYSVCGLTTVDFTTKRLHYKRHPMPGQSAVYKQYSSMTIMTLENVKKNSCDRPRTHKEVVFPSIWEKHRERVVLGTPQATRALRPSPPWLVDGPPPLAYRNVTMLFQRLPLTLARDRACGPSLNEIVAKERLFLDL